MSAQQQMAIHTREEKKTDTQTDKAEKCVSYKSVNITPWRFRSSCSGGCVGGDGGRVGDGGYVSDRSVVVVVVASSSERASGKLSEMTNNNKPSTQLTARPPKAGDGHNPRGKHTVSQYHRSGCLSFLSHLPPSPCLKSPTRRFSCHLMGLQ